MQKKQLVLIGVIIAVLIGIIVIFIRIPTKTEQKETVQQTQEVVHQKEVALTRQLLDMDVSDPSHVRNVKFLQEKIERYFNDYRYYPKRMEDMIPHYLPVPVQFATGENYLYAYYPKDKPTKYHLGAKLGGRNPADIKTLSEDADFNSIKAGYVGGFVGVDPVYDLVSKNK